MIVTEGGAGCLRLPGVRLWPFGFGTHPRSSDLVLAHFAAAMDRLWNCYDYSTDFGSPGIILPSITGFSQNLPRLDSLD